MSLMLKQYVKQVIIKIIQIQLLLALFKKIFKSKPKSEFECKILKIGIVIHV